MTLILYLYDFFEPLAGDYWSLSNGNYETLTAEILEWDESQNAWVLLGVTGETMISIGADYFSLPDHAPFEYPTPGKPSRRIEDVRVVCGPSPTKRPTNDPSSNVF